MDVNILYIYDKVINVGDEILSLLFLKYNDLHTFYILFPI